MIRCLLFIILILAHIVYASASQVDVDLEQLEAINLSLKESFALGDESEIALSVELMGKDINRDIYTFNIEKKPVYSDPLSCCIATCRAILEDDDKWYSEMATPANMRNEKGIPIDGYSPDLSGNLYNMYTYHKINPAVPKPDSVLIKRFLRIGGMYAFQIEVHQTHPAGDTYPSGEITGTDLRTIQCFDGKFFRFEPKWAHPSATIFPVIASSVKKSEKMKQYTNSNASLLHEVQIDGLFGDMENRFPLKLFFLGSAVDESLHFKKIQKRLSYMKELYTDFLLKNNTFKNKNKEKNMVFSEILDKQSLEMFIQNEYTGLNIDDNIAYIIDCGDGTLLIYNYNKSHKINKNYIALHRENNNIKIGNLFSTTQLSRFLHDDRIWKPLSFVIEEDISQKDSNETE
jgi:hypothetical protein